MSSPEWRRKYEFSVETKKKVRREQRGKCIVTGEKSYTEIHHNLGIALARGFFPTVDPKIFTQRENAVAINPEDHKLLHDQMREWPDEFLRLYVVGLYKYLRDLKKEKTKLADSLRPDKVRRVI